MCVTWKVSGDQEDKGKQRADKVQSEKLSTVTKYRTKGVIQNFLIYIQNRYV